MNKKKKPRKINCFTKKDCNIKKYISMLKKCASIRAPTTFKLEGEVTSLSESSQGEVGDNREKWGDFWEKLIVINISKGKGMGGGGGGKNKNHGNVRAQREGGKKKKRGNEI
jgi:hypothetical protein